MSLYTEFKINEVFNMPDIPDKIKVTGYTDSTNPFIPKINPDYVFRRDFLREVIAFLRFPEGDSLFVSGPTGSGKIVIVVTDGEPNNSEACQAVLNLYQQSDVEVIGIATTAVADLFARHIVIQDASCLQQTLFKLMAQSLTSV